MVIEDSYTYGMVKKKKIKLYLSVTMLMGIYMLGYNSVPENHCPR